MKILIISPGKAHDRTVADAIAGYERRLGPKLSLEWSLPPAGDRDAEAKAILKQLKDGDYVLLLDERGADLDTAGLAAFVDARLQAGTKRLVCIVGGAFGVSGAVRERADRTVKLSSLTLPHMLVRLLLVEQLYRAQSILAGSAYHHA